MTAVEQRVEPLLSVRNLGVVFQTDEGEVRAVDDVSLDVRRGEVIGLVGESGCGKSVTALSLLRLIPSPPGRISSGKVLFEGDDLLRLPVPALRQIRGRRIGMIFQEPMTALSPLHRIGSQLVEAQREHLDLSAGEAWSRGVSWLERVGIPDPLEKMNAYPFQLSGGMRQRVMIASVLMLEPDLVIADEPTTALDVTIQAQILDLLLAVRSSDMAVILITHDMGVVWETCDRILVMYASQIVEEGTRDEIFRHPAHPYTRALLQSIPSLSAGQERLPSIPGQVPSPLAYPRGCRFRDRCPMAMDQCGAVHPVLEPMKGRSVRCIRAGELMSGDHAGGGA